MKKEVWVTSREALLSLDAVYGLAVFLNTLDETRRPVLDWLADVIFGWIEAGGVIIDGEGNQIEIWPDTIDDAHGEDGSAKWVSEQRLRVANPPKRRQRQSLWLRMALYDAAARITTGRSIIEFGQDTGE